jgi:hypothetical protein
MNNPVVGTMDEPKIGSRIWFAKDHYTETCLEDVRYL